MHLFSGRDSKAIMADSCIVGRSPLLYRSHSLISVCPLLHSFSRLQVLRTGNCVQDPVTHQYVVAPAVDGRITRAGGDTETL
jgi:hypothetical protein